jgi:chorismate synthase
MNNSYGQLFRVTSFGESHGRCVGVVVDGCPAGLPISLADIQKEVDKRKPEEGAGQTARREEDQVEILSGVFNGFATGAPICLLVWNKDVDSSSYEQNRFIPRPGHADLTAFLKYGGFNDYRGGGRFSGRITAGAVMAGAIARKALSNCGIEVLAYTMRIGDIKLKAATPEQIRQNVYRNAYRVADLDALPRIDELMENLKKEGDSIGGVVEGLALNVPPGLGEPVFDTLDGEMAKVLLSIPAVKGVQFGEGFSSVGIKGSENNDAFRIREGKVVSDKQYAGGILGGISNGMTLEVKVAIKPTPSIAKKQDSVDLQKMQDAQIEIKGRHDSCIAPRAVIVVESMLAITLCDFALRAGILPGVVK